jgi:hypothetical protein
MLRPRANAVTLRKSDDFCQPCNHVIAGSFATRTACRAGIILYNLHARFISTYRGDADNGSIGTATVPHVEATRHCHELQVSIAFLSIHRSCAETCNSLFLTLLCAFCRHERDLERLSPNIAASPSDLGVKVGGAGSSEFVFPEDRNRYR